VSARKKKERAEQPARSSAISEQRVSTWLHKAQLQLHPWAAEIPRMSEEQFQLHKEDIKRHGQRDPIWLKERYLVDGLHRLGACIELKIEPRFEQYPKDDLVEFIFSENLFRRHLTDDQRAALVSKAFGPQLEQEARERQAEAGGDRRSTAYDENRVSGRSKAGSFGKKVPEGGSVAEKIAERAGVSEHKARQAEKARKAGMLDDVIAKKEKLRSAAKKAPSKKRKPKKELPFSDQVYASWTKWINHFSPLRRREIMAWVRSWTEWFDQFEPEEAGRVAEVMREWGIWFNRQGQPKKVAGLVRKWIGGGEPKGGAAK
jgi:hypothetical protein